MARPTGMQSCFPLEKDKRPALDYATPRQSQGGQETASSLNPFSNPAASLPNSHHTQSPHSLQFLAEAALGSDLEMVILYEM